MRRYRVSYKVTASQNQPILELLAAAAEQEHAAQEAVVSRIYGRVHRLANTLCASRADADDVTQQTLLAVLQNAATFRAEASFERWVDRITARCASGAARREGRRKRLLDRWLPPDRAPWGVDLWVRAQEPTELDDVLAQLPGDRHRAIILRHGYGYSVDEISKMLGVPRGTIKDRLVCGKKQLRKMLRRSELMAH
jgi:RNA polymerase sigma-70 factor, ECF subfamily